MIDSDQNLVAIGKWIYDSKTECVVHLVRSNIAYGSGDYQDPPEVRDDREGTFYYLNFFSPADSNDLCSKSGAFENVELAKKAAAKMCAKLIWDK